MPDTDVQLLTYVAHFLAQPESHLLTFVLGFGFATIVVARPLLRRYDKLHADLIEFSRQNLRDLHALIAERPSS